MLAGGVRPKVVRVFLHGTHSRCLSRASLATRDGRSAPRAELAGGSDVAENSELSTTMRTFATA